MKLIVVEIYKNDKILEIWKVVCNSIFVFQLKIITKIPTTSIIYCAVPSVGRHNFVNPPHQEQHLQFSEIYIGIKFIEH